MGRPLVLEDETPTPEPPVVVPQPTEPYLSGFVPLDPPVVAKVEPPEVDAEPLTAPVPVPAPEGLLWADLEA